jgi:hypothetical protein
MNHITILTDEGTQTVSLASKVEAMTMLAQLDLVGIAATLKVA